MSTTTIRMSTISPRKIIIRRERMKITSKGGKRSHYVLFAKVGMWENAGRKISSVMLVGN